MAYDYLQSPLPKTSRVREGSIADDTSVQPRYGFDSLKDLAQGTMNG
jgi:hypothetical protein